MQFSSLVNEGQPQRLRCLGEPVTEFSSLVNEGQPQQFPVRTSFSNQFSRASCKTIGSRDFLPVSGTFFEGWILGPKPAWWYVGVSKSTTYREKAVAPMPMSQSISDRWRRFQGELFPQLAEEVGRMSERHQQLVSVLEFAPPETCIPGLAGLPGRPRQDRVALARAFIAKAIWNLRTTRDLIDRVRFDPTLRRLCGWSRVGAIPSEATFSRAFAEFARTGLPARLHEELVRSSLETSIVGHVSRDSTAIAGREKPAAKPKPPSEKRPRGRPRKGEERPKELARLDRQPAMGVAAMIAELPTACDVGMKARCQGVQDDLGWLQAPY